MRYDEEKISWIIADKRRAFKIRFSIIATIMLSALVVSIVNISDYLTVLCLMLEFPLIFLLVRVIKRFDAKTLMSGEVQGKNIKEYEYGVRERYKAKTSRNMNTA